MIEGVIGALIQICLVVLVVYVVFWVLGVIGIPLPPNVVQIIWVIVALFCLLIIIRMVLPGISRFGAIGDTTWQVQAAELNEEQLRRQSEWLRQRSPPL